MDEQRNLTIADSAAYLCIGQRTLRTLIAAREIPVVRIRRRVVIRRADLDAYLDKHLEPAEV